MQSVLNVANRKAHEGMQALVYMRGRLAEEEEKLQQLVSYQQEYQQSLSAGNSASWSAHSMLSYRNFYESVGVAIEQQRNQLKQVNLQLEQVNQAWKQLDARCQSLDKTKSRLEVLETNEASRVEQKAMDEISIRNYFHNTTNGITRQ